MKFTIFKVSRTNIFFPSSNVDKTPPVSINKFSTNFLIGINEAGTGI